MWQGSETDLRSVVSGGRAAPADRVMGRRFYLLAVIIAIGLAASAQTPALLLFGGTNHKTFLGCLNCSKYDSASVCNKYGDVGSRYSSDSIWNRYGNFGSKYSSDSPWNKYSSSAPIIVGNLEQYSLSAISALAERAVAALVPR